MPATTISNKRDLVVQLLGELLFVERRLADSVLPELGRSVHDDGLKAALEQHHEETKAHVDRVETAFRRLEVAPTSNLSRPFESAVAEHDEIAPSIVDPRLADLYHAHVALHTEHWEVAAYRTLLPLVPDALRDLLRQSLEDESRTEAALLQAIDGLARAS
jgi:ferritin-like metal-binding protein YciE